MNYLLKRTAFLFFIFITAQSFSQEQSADSQDLTAELGFSAGLALPSEEMYAKIGPALQLDYRLLKKNFGIQFSMNYLRNNMDEEALKAQVNARSASAGTWTSISGMLKLIGRISSVQDKLLFDISVGFGIMQSRFPDQSYSYSQNSPNNYIYVASEASSSSSFSFGAGLRAHYRFREDASLGISYDLQTANQNYSIKGTKSDASTEVVFSGINMIYSNLMISVNYFFK